MMSPKLLTFASLLLGAAGCAAPLQVRETRLAARDGLSCLGYTTFREEGVTDVVVGLHGSGPLSNAFLPEALEPLLESRPVAYVTMDKPGVRATFGDPAEAQMDVSALARHTQGTLLDCVSALHAATRAEFGATTRFHFRGHSEGSLLSLAFLERLLRTHPEQARLVNTLVLSGVSLEPVLAAVERQLAVMPKLSRAVKACDEKTMVPALGFGCAWLRDLPTRPSGFELFERLAAAAPATRFRVFHGTRDKHTPVRFVRELEAWNRARGGLDLDVRYYDGWHQGTPDVREEVASLLMSLIPERSRSRAPSTATTARW